ncbi:MAG TPA: ThuA domain-containing protein [Methylomirabilota bacterium]
MSRRRHFLGLFVVALGFLLAAAPRPSAPARVLMVTYSAGYQHDVVRRPAAGVPSIAERVVTDLARRSGRFEITPVNTREELGALTVAAVRSYRGILFFTTGELPMAPDVRHAVFRAVHDGAGFIGVHSATDTWYTVPEYGALVGATFDGHPWHQRVRILVEDAMHPATRHLRDGFEIEDEIYQFRAWSRPRVHVLLRLDPRSVDVGRGKRSDGDYALAWTARQGRGHVFYTALGHEPGVWADERFHTHLRGAIEWALGHD